MSSLLESYRVLGVKVGAGMADVTTSYRQLCRTYHPDITDDPDAEELMKQINIAYTVLREKFKRETAFRERQPYSRPVRRYPQTETRQQSGETWQQKPGVRQQASETRKKTEDAQQQASSAHQQRAEERAAASATAEKEAYAVLHEYFNALNAFDYPRAYLYLSDHDKNHIPLESFSQWREAVARLYPMREFKIAGGSSLAVVTWGEEKTYHARKFRVIITEDDYSDDATQKGDVDKLVINENGNWGVFLGYKEVNELTLEFDKRFETKKKRDIEKRWEEYSAGLHLEYNMQNLDGLRKSVLREMYRQRRYGGSMTLAAISIRHNDMKNAGQEELLRSAAKTINGMVRETDVAAYAEDGVFAIMFVELGRKNADNIIERLIETIRKNAGPQLGKNAEIAYEYDTWFGNSYANIETLNGILGRVRKKI